ncbi:hypothetical protein [Helicobacter canis]|uniref:DUF8201 domain-containing protein n=1 Tax=Helicobacter canis NCTC 12740 TaxID=1357399 RepID=V8CKI7_9HELI|nr:hypothetical protein [Helicobacter canis]ETD27879.1 hypothetical protein HMPREF2087_00803 [Helicobacter canis NCTC 12740]
MIEKLLHIGVINGSIALVLCVWILAVYGYGFMALKLACKRYAIFGSLLGHSLALASLLAFIAGSFMLMFFVCVWHLFFPLWGWVSVVVAMLGLILFGVGLRAFVAGVGKQVALSGLLALLVVLPLSTLSDSVGDSVNYHIQIVTWIQESPLVFGLGNVHTRLGYNGLIYGFYALTDVSQMIPSLRSFVGNEVMYFSFLFSAFLAFVRLLQSRIARFYELFIICALMPFPLILKWGEFMGLYVEGVGVVFGVAIFATLLYIMDSASGNHSSDFVDFRATADLKSSSALKSTKSTTSNTANPRILEEEKQAESKNQTTQESSSRAAKSGVAIHSSNTQKLESSMDCHEAVPTSRNDKKLDSIALARDDKEALPLFTLLFLFALFATMVKIANFALILAVALCFVLVYKRQILSKSFIFGLLGLGALSALLVLPWVLKGLATSGMIAYPASIGYITSLPWAVSEEARQNEVCWIMSWARAPLKNCREVLADSAWMVEWFSMKTRYFSYFKYFVYSFFIGLGFVLAARLYTGRRISGFGVVLVCIVIGVLYWFFAGPDPRFGMVYLIPLLGILFAYVLSQSYRAGSLWLAFGFVLACAPMFMNGRQMFVIVWGVLLVLLMWQRLGARWLVGCFVLFSLISVPNLYRHDKWGILEYPKVREVYVQERVSDLGVLEYVRFDTPNENTQAILYEARPMTPYFNQNLGKGEFLGREMFYTQEPKP